MKKRLLFFAVVVGIMVSVLSVRLAYIQIIGHEELSEAAKKQQSVRLDGADGRGVIYDRNGVPLTGVNKEYVYILPKSKLDENAKRLLKQIDARRLWGNNQSYGVYTTGTYRKEETRKLIRENGAYVMEAERRYASSQLAAHLIGYVNPSDAKGTSGLERMYDEQLSARTTKIYAVADASGQILQGYGLSKISAGEKSGLNITLDSRLQKKVEEILQQAPYNGAIVVLDTKTGELLASASTPAFNPNVIDNYIDSSNMELINKSTQGEYPPGSIFKIVVAAAALENGALDKEGRLITPDTKFFCNGKESLYGIDIGCMTGGETGHGEITLRDGFAKSCNSTFVQLGKLTGAKAILDMAKKMGLGQQPFSEIPDVKTGNLMTEEDSMWAGIGNLSIGQGETLTTPLQIARMTSIVANDGMDYGVHLVLTDAPKVYEGQRVLSEKTALIIKAMMEDVMKYGTGSNSDLFISTAGKTGSAEGVYEGEETVHGWFTGFLPAENPAYTVTVFMENGKSGRSSALPVFNQIGNYLERQMNQTQ